MRRIGIAVLILGLLAAGSACAGDLHADIEGYVYDGNSPEPVGRIRPGRAGPIWVDDLGDIRVGNDPGIVGHTYERSGRGRLHIDVYGDVRAGGSPFEIDEADKVFRLR